MTLTDDQQPKVDPQPQAAPDAEAVTLSRFITARVAILSRLINIEVGRRYMRDFGLTMPQWRVVATLGQHREMAVTAISREVFMDRGQTSRTLDSLMESGLVRMRPDTRDRRSTLFSLSPAGEDLFVAVLPAATRAQEELLDGVSAEDRETFGRVLDHLTARVRSRIENGPGGLEDAAGGPPN